MHVDVRKGLKDEDTNMGAHLPIHVAVFTTQEESHFCVRPRIFHVGVFLQKCL